MSSLLITGGRVIDPANSFDALADVFLRDGKIVAVGSEAAKLADANSERLDARGKIVCPGLIDLHAHLREPGQSAKETIATGTRAAWNGRLENLPTCRHECRRYAVTPAFQPAGSETFQSRVRATVEKCPPPQACSLEFEGWSLFGFWCLVFGVFSGPVAQRLEQGTHNPLVLGSNPSRPTTSSGKFQNPNAKLQTVHLDTVADRGTAAPGCL